MKKSIILASLIIALGALVPVSVSAHPGNTDSFGCHTCRTNCSSWGLSYGEYHCHNSRGLPQPEDPIRSHYGSGGTGWTEPWPEYNNGYSFPSIPSCPLFSSYDSLSGDCKCYSGYVAQGSECVSTESICRDRLGFNSRYNSLTDTCECRYGYVIDGGKCVTEDDYCENNFGWNAEYDILTDKCRCKSGYVVSDSGTSCISGDTYCQGKFGTYSSYNSLSKSCECDSGYEVRNGVCQREVESGASLFRFFALPDDPSEETEKTPIVIPTKTPSKLEDPEGPEPQDKSFLKDIPEAEEAKYQSAELLDSVANKPVAPIPEEPVKKESFFKKVLRWLGLI